MRSARRLPMSLRLIALWSLASLSSTNIAQEPEIHVSNHGVDVDVYVRSSRPWQQLQSILFHKYGWVIDYEDPSFDVRETTDATNPEWIRQHPDNPSRAFDPTRGTFQAQFPQPRKGQIDEEQSLNTLVDQYDKQPLSGFFKVVHSEDGRFHVVGSSRYQEGKPTVLDKVLTMRFKEESAADRLSLLAKVCSNPDNTIVLGMTPINYLSQILMKADFAHDTCRAEIDKVLKALPTTTVLDLLFDPGGHASYLNISNAKELP